MPNFLTARHARRGLAVFGALAVFATAACSVDEILDVTDPDIINPEDLQTPAGATALRNGAYARLVQITGGSSAQSESFWLMGGLMADEWRSGDTFLERNETDARSVRVQNSILETTQRLAHRARVTALQARISSQANDPTAAAWQIAEMLLIQAYAEIMLAEHVCNGIPLSYVLNGTAFDSDPLTNAQVFTIAAAHADSALALLGTGTDANTVRTRGRANAIKARALLDLGQFTQAAAAATLVPAGMTWNVDFSDNTWYNQLWSLNNSAGRYTLPATAEGPLGMDWVGTQDPRVPNCRGGTTACNAAGATDPIVFDNASGLPRWAQLIYPTRYSSVPITNYTESRLIIAEALMRAGNATFVDTLNALRATVTGLLPLVDPVTQTAREDLLFRERGFWLFGRGYRLGDMRRLIRQYSRPVNSVFPSGTYIKGGTFGTDVNFPVVQAEQNNPKFSGCLDRNA